MFWFEHISLYMYIQDQCLLTAFDYARPFYKMLVKQTVLFITDESAEERAD